MTQPTALFLADVIDADADAESHHAAAAGELRRLHAQRDALLTALKMIAGTVPCLDYMMSDKDIARAAIAIAKAEGEMK